MIRCATNTTGTVNGHRPENVVFLKGGGSRSHCPTRVSIFIRIKMTNAQLVSRRARVKQLIAEGRVMTDAMRKKQKEVAKYQEKLETLADRILSGRI